MPKITAERLGEIGRALFIAAGTPPAEADIVMRHVVAANLAGHDSHGVIQIPTYIERIKVGHIVPGAPWKIVQESPTTTVVDGHWGFGYVVNERAMKLTIEKAKSANVAAATVFRQGHIGHHIRNRSDDEAFDLYFEDENRFWKYVQLYGTLTGMFWVLIYFTNVIVLFRPAIITPRASVYLAPRSNRPTTPSLRSPLTARSPAGTRRPNACSDLPRPKR